MEYRDLYDENRKLTGEKIKKGGIVPNNRYYITVAVWIENTNGEFLLQINKKYNKWAPTGGHPKSGESSIEGIIAEIKEEIGLDVIEEELKLYKTIKTEDDFVDLYYLKKDINLTDIIIDEEEVGEVKWFSTIEINKLIKNDMLLPFHKLSYKEYLKYLQKK